MTKEEFDLEIRNFIRSHWETEKQELLNDAFLPLEAKLDIAYGKGTEAKKKKLYIVSGIFGGDAFVDGKGILLKNSIEYKIFGCSYTWKFLVKHNDFIDSLAGVKRSLIENIRFIGKKPFLFFFVSRKDIESWLIRVCLADLDKKKPTRIERHEVMQEIERAGRTLFNSDFWEYVSFFTADTAYCFMFQEFMSELNKENFRKNTNKELKRLLNLLIERDMRGFTELGVKDKLRLLLKLLPIIFIFKPRFKKLIRDFILEIDQAKVRFSESDWYFCLDRIDYNYGGFTFREREKIKNLIDQKKGHYIIPMQHEGCLELLKNMK